MSDLRQAAQQALEALERGETKLRWAAIAALKQALAEPEQEPVAWAVYDILHGGSKTLHWPEHHSPNGDPNQYKAVPLYTAPTPRKPLSEQQRIDLVRACGFPKFNDWHDAAIGVTHSVERAHGIGEQQ